MNEIDTQDRNKIVLHSVTSIKNMSNMKNFVKLGYNIGIHNISFGHILCTKQEHAALCLIREKEKYNEYADEALNEGKSLGVSVGLRKFFNERAQDKKLNSCKSPFTDAFISIDGNLSPCCYMNNFPLPNVWEHGFEAAWFSPQMHKLRRTRFTLACKRCIPYTVFDDPFTHIASDLKDTISVE